MIYYQSTRGYGKIYSFSEVVLKGLSDDGGLLIPEKIPQVTLDELTTLVNKSYQDIALYLFNKFETDIENKILKKLIGKAYSKNFDNKDIAPVKYLKNNKYILELWHGPTSAFKDYALQLTPLIFSEVIRKESKSNSYLIIVATSGDTGKAALEGYKDKENIKIICLFPKKRVSHLQELSMVTQEGENLKVFPVSGDFDDIQRVVKEVFNDKKFNEDLFNKFHIKLSAANSINWGRLLPQIFYYFSSYLYLVKKDKIKLGEKINFAVPVGNAGNILAGYIAKKMGLSINKFIAASNENNVLSDFFNTGVFDIRDRKIKKTPSPAMDILVPSNLERLLYFITNDKKKIKNWMIDLKENKKFVVDQKTKKEIQELIFADYVSNKDCLKNINAVFSRTKYLMDPHTSVAYTISEKFKSSLPTIVVSTAHWSKFSENIKKKDSFVPKWIKNLKTKEIIYKNTLAPKKEVIEREIINFVK